MREKQKWLCLTVAGLLALGLLAGCGEVAEPTTDEPVEQEQQTTEQQPTTPTADTITAEPMTDERHLAAQQAVTAPAVEMARLSTRDLLDEINVYIAALDDTLPIYKDDIAVQNELATSLYYTIPLTESLFLTSIENTEEAGGGLSNFNITIEKSASESDWAAAQDYFYAISYCLDRERPSNLWQALAVEAAAQPGDSNGITCNGIAYSYGFTGDFYSFSMMPTWEENWQPGEIKERGPIEGFADSY